MIDVICPASEPRLRGLKLELSFMSFRNPAEMRTASGWRSALPSSSFLAAWDAMGHGPWAMGHAWHVAWSAPYLGTGYTKSSKINRNMVTIFKIPISVD